MRQGYDTLRRGDLDAYADLVAPDATWVGVEPEDGSEPAMCHDRSEILTTVRRNLRSQLEGTLEHVVDGRNGAAVSVRLVGPEGDAGYWHHVVEAREGKIVRMRDTRSREEALRLAGAGG
ncbi:MAG TPA: nuclear transport factor 2 family protein [Actinomycetota bacterium]|nr:nuclear transport factor 2 family protein [Actinomycetota bacterium]